MNWQRLWFQAKAYVRYYSQAKNAHQIHSPFVFDFYNQVFKPRLTEYAAVQDIEALRKELQQCQQSICVEDLGAGAVRQGRYYVRQVAQMVRQSIKSPAYAQLLYRMVQFQQPNVIIELGTSLGLTTAYLAKAAPQASIYTLEGCPQIAQLAQQHFNALRIENVQLIVGNIDETLPVLLKQLPCIDFLFADANHQYEPTLRYLHWCMQQRKNSSVFVIDDIHWSAGMQRAWNELRALPEVVTDIDLFQMGFLFFQPIHPKQSFVLR